MNDLIGGSMEKKYALGLYEKAMPENLSWRDKLETAKKYGYDFVEISIDETEQKLKRLDMTSNERMEFIRLMQETGVPVRSMCLSGHRKYPLGSSDPKVETRGMDIMEKAIRLADDLGIRIIQLAGYDVYYEQSTDETKKRFQRNLIKSVLMASRFGIMLGFETMETEFMNTVQKAMKYVEGIHHAYLTLYPDIGNLSNAAVKYNTDVLDDLKTGDGHIAAIHLKEAMPGKFREIPFGTGQVQFEKIIAAAWKIGVRRFVTELWYTGKPDWEEEVELAAKMMSRILDKQDYNIRYN